MGFIESHRVPFDGMTPALLALVFVLASGTRQVPAERTGRRRPLRGQRSIGQIGRAADETKGTVAPAEGSGLRPAALTSLPIARPRSQRAFQHWIALRAQIAGKCTAVPAPRSMLVFIIACVFRT